MKKFLPVIFAFLIFIPLPLQAYDGQVIWENRNVLIFEGDDIVRTVYIGGEGRSYREMLACALWLEANWQRRQTGKANSGEKCEDFLTKDLVILRITKGRVVLGENSYYIDYIHKSKIK